MGKKQRHQVLHYAAAGGVVVRGNQVLVLNRPGRDEVRLPKGHVEEAESVQHAALREVTEESGYADVEIRCDLGQQIVEFDFRGRHVIRVERYFLMAATSLRQVEREAQESQFIPDWLGWDDALAKLTFEPEREWVRRARIAYTTAS
jgi:8-oxo-dGTP pyrophosphatase MutT (NUDIX family)